MGADPVGETEQSGAAVGLGAAAAVVDDRDDQRAVLPGEGQRYLRSVGVLDGVRDGLAGNEIRRRLDVAGETLGQRGDVEPDRRARRELAQSRAEPFIERAGPEPTRQLAQLVDRRGELGDRLVDRPSPWRGSARSCACRSASPIATSLCWAPS